MRDAAALDAAVHHHLIRTMLDRGWAPSNADLAASHACELADVEAALRRLERGHGVVLHPHACEVWVIHPFSTSPTHTWVEKGGRGWWAPCVWCALGIATLAGGDVVLHTRLGGERENVAISVRDGDIAADDLWVHFPEPPRLAWNNVHHFCARLLPFRSPDDVPAWSARHGLPLGEIVPIAQLAQLAKPWYGRHADLRWRKWTTREAAEIFRSVGLVDGFWQIDGGEGAF
jgi:Alkylmercury lyase